jgi:glucose/arabinose dehydrogenase
MPSQIEHGTWIRERPAAGQARVLLLVALPALLACASAESRDPPASAANGLGVRVVVSGLRHPVYLAAPDGDARLFVVEQAGRIRIVRGGRLLATPFLDITDRVRSGGEQGLLSIAFHPRYRSNGFLFVNYTDLQGDTRVERYRVGSDPDRADASSARRLLHIEQPYANHNGGHMLFGPDGMLYVGIGDGGSGGDPHGNGQNRGSPLGKLLRIDVDHGEPYGIPAGNPFAGRAGMRPEIWAWGLRNPWRFCFDPPTGLLYIADVGQNRWEEIHVAPADRAGLNYGWNIMEGAHCYRAPRCDRAGLELPVLEYDHSQGCSITGGFVYRGRDVPELIGHYVYADYCHGWIRSFRYARGAAVDRREWEVGDVGQVTSFGLDGRGELYVLSENGRVYRVVRAERG